MASWCSDLYLGSTLRDWRWRLLASQTYYSVQEQSIAQIADCIKRQRKKMICLNDTDVTTNFDYLKEEVIDAFEFILPDRCSFERN